MLKFYYNGIKANGGKLQRAHYSFGNYTIESGRDQSSITIYARDYAGFSREVAEAFDVINNSDGQTDYFEKDRIVVAPAHPLYTLVLAAYDAQEMRRRKCSAAEVVAERARIVEANTVRREAHLGALIARMGSPITQAIQ